MDEYAASSERGRTRAGYDNPPTSRRRREAVEQHRGVLGADCGHLATHRLPLGVGQAMEGPGVEHEPEARVIRNAGGVVTDDAIRSLTISQTLLGTEEIVLIHHTDCGMLTFTDDELRGRIERETGIKPAWASEAFADLDADVRQSIARIQASPFIPHRDRVRGFVYEVENGRLREIT
jgi:hypothetical protein